MTRRPSSPPDALDPLFQTALNFHQDGNLQHAEHLYREVLRQNPRHGEALNMLGVIGCQSGNPRAGAALIRDALVIDPTHPDYNNNLGMALLATGDGAAALAAFECAVKSRPRFPEAQCNLANALLGQAHPERAEKHYRKALKAKPDYPDALNNLGNLLRQRGAFVEASQLLRKLVRLQPEFAPGHFNLALALQAQSLFDPAIESYRRSLELDPGQAAVWEALGHCRRSQGALSEAEVAYARALECGAPTAQLLNALGLARFAQNRVEEARASFEQALAIDDNLATTLDHLGMTASALGHEVAAAEYFERALAADPGYGSAYRNLVELRSASDSAPALTRRIIQALSESGSDSERVEMEFALGSLHDRAGDYESAFAAYTRANATRRAAIEFDARAQSAYIDALRSVFTRDFFSTTDSNASDSETPVFIVGMPRSGTTLVEQIIDSHRRVFGAGELTFFAEQVATMTATLHSNKAFPFCVPGHTAELAKLAPSYLALLRSRSADAERISDKMPYNFLYLGIIAILFPQARIIHCRRDPMATCFSIFTHDLAGNHPYSYALDELAAAFRGYERLMEHWRDHLPLRMLEVDYESLTQDLDSGCHAIIEFLGLEWDPACLDFHHNTRAVTSASQWQVRRPVYTTSRAHWQHYTQHLEPLRRALKMAAGT